MKTNQVKDKDHKEVTSVAAGNAFDYAMNRIEQCGLFDDSEMTDVQRALDMGIAEVVNAAWQCMFNNTDGVEPETVEEAIEIAEKDACDYVDGFIDEQLEARRGTMPVSQEGAGESQSLDDGAQDIEDMDSGLEEEMDQTLDLETQALAAYFKKFGEHAAAPSAPEIVSEGGREYVVLENTYGVLAVYEIVDDETVVWSDYLPDGYSEDEDMRRAEA